MQGAQPPRRSPVLLFLFRLYLRWLFWRRFGGVRVLTAPAPLAFAGRPLVVYCNHPSWWDPALLLLTIPLFFPYHRGYGPMDAAALQRYRMLGAMGVFGIEMTHPRAAAQFLHTAKKMLQAPDMCLCVTAEGAFTDPRLRPIKLRRGLAHLAAACPGAVFLPLALEYCFWNESKPEALMAFGEPVVFEGASPASWQTQLEQALTRTMDRLAAASAARRPQVFDLVMRGTAGVGGPYDAWRRLISALRGRRFDPRHQPEPPS